MKNKVSISIILLYLLSLSLYFWTQSRYPALGGKAGTGIFTDVPDYLSFDMLIQHIHGEIWIQEIIVSFINWSYTNWKGMTFGILFGIGFLTLIHFLDVSKLPKNRFSLAVIGVLDGVGLGVCANCSTPIGKSIISSGISPIIALNTIISSPTFNIVGIGLMFSTFPWYIALTKILFYIVIMLVIVPLVFGEDSLKEVRKKNVYCKNKKNISSKKSIPQELSYLGKVFLRSCRFIIIKTVPLMALGGFLGVTITSFISEGLLNSLEVNILNIIGVGIVSLFLPVPILFDVIFSGIAYQSSIPSIFAILLLLNLGGFSIYPFLVLQQNIKLQKMLLFCSLFVILSSLTASLIYSLKINYFDKPNIVSSTLDPFFSQTGKREYKNLDAINQLSSEEIDKIFLPNKITAKSSDQDIPDVFNTSYLKNNLEIIQYKLNIPQEDNEKFFELHYGEALGINNLGYRLSHMFSGIGISDYNNDGWEDIILPSANGIKIYKNIGSKFVLDTNFNLGEILGNEEITQANFYDLDGDQLKDLIAITRLYGVYILWNNNGKIDISDSLNFDFTADENFSYGMSIGDLFNDNNLDIFIGEFSAVDRNKKLQNLILKNNGNRIFEQQWLQKDILGATTVGLIWDFDNDGKNELFEGNDFGYSSDIIYSTTNNGELIFDNNMNQIIPITPYSQMGITIGDINNDLVPEYFLSGSEGLNNENLNHKNKVDDTYLSACIFPNLSGEKRKQKEIDCEVKEMILISSIRNECGNIQNIYIQNLCHQLRLSSSRNEFDNEKSKQKFCESIKNSFHFGAYYNYCLGRNELKLTSINNLDDKIPQTDGNVLIMDNKNIVNDIENLNSGWSWGAFFADLDNNGYEDLYVGNGHLHNNRPKEPNKLMMNYSGSLTPKHTEYGIENYLDTVTSSYIDFDNDGDLDIINTSIFGDVIFYENKIIGGNSIIIDLLDSQSENTEAVGAKIILSTDNNRKMIRNFYIGGHFLTSQNTQVHFGIPKGENISNIEIFWPDGTISRISEGLKTNYKYLIKR